MDWSLNRIRAPRRRRQAVLSTESLEGRALLSSFGLARERTEMRTMMMERAALHRGARHVTPSPTTTPTGTTSAPATTGDPTGGTAATAQLTAATPAITTAALAAPTATTTGTSTVTNGAPSALPTPGSPMSVATATITSAGSASAAAPMGGPVMSMPMMGGPVLTASPMGGFATSGTAMGGPAMGGFGGGMMVTTQGGGGFGGGFGSGGGAGFGFGGGGFGFAGGTGAGTASGTTTTDPRIAAIQQYQADVKTIYDKSQVTPALQAALTNDLQAISKAATTAPDQTKVLALQSDLSSLGGTLPTSAQLATLQTDFAAVATSEGVTDASKVTQTFTDLNALIAATNISSGDVTTLTNDLKAAGLSTAAPLVAPLGVNLQILNLAVNYQPVTTMAPMTTTATSTTTSTS